MEVLPEALADFRTVEVGNVQAGVGTGVFLAPGMDQLQGLGPVRRVKFEGYVFTVTTEAHDRVWEQELDEFVTAFAEFEIGKLGDDFLQDAKFVSVSEAANVQFVFVDQEDSPSFVIAPIAVFHGLVSCVYQFVPEYFANVQVGHDVRVVAMELFECLGLVAEEAAEVVIQDFSNRSRA